MTKKLSNVAAITDNDITGARCSALQQNLQRDLQLRPATEPAAPDPHACNLIRPATPPAIADDDGGAVQAARDARAAKALDNQAAHQAELKARQKATNDMKANASSRTDHDLLDDVDADGNSVADARAKKAPTLALAVAPAPTLTTLALGLALTLSPTPNPKP